MAQSTAVSHVNIHGFREWQNLAVSVPAAGVTTLLQMNVKNMSRIFVQFDVTVNAFDQFLIIGKCCQDATNATLFSTAASYTSLPAGGIMIGTSGDLTTQAVGSGWFILDVTGLYEITVQASGSGGASTVSIYAGGA